MGRILGSPSSANGSGVLRAVLSGIEGPDHTLKMPRTVEQQFTAITRLVARDPVLSREIPDLTKLIRPVLADAQRKPYSITVADSQSPNPATVVLGRFDIEPLIVGMMAVLQLCKMFQKLNQARHSCGYLKQPPRTAFR